MRAYVSSECVHMESDNVLCTKQNIIAYGRCFHLHIQKTLIIPLLNLFKTERTEKKFDKPDIILHHYKTLAVNKKEYACAS